MAGTTLRDYQTVARQAVAGFESAANLEENRSARGRISDIPVDPNAQFTGARIRYRVLITVRRSDLTSEQRLAIVTNDTPMSASEIEEFARAHYATVRDSGFRTDTRRLQPIQDGDVVTTTVISAGRAY